MSSLSLMVLLNNSCLFHVRNPFVIQILFTLLGCLSFYNAILRWWNKFFFVLQKCHVLVIVKAKFETLLHDDQKRAEVVEQSFLGAIQLFWGYRSRLYFRRFSVTWQQNLWSVLNLQYSLGNGLTQWFYSWSLNLL